MSTPRPKRVENRGHAPPRVCVGPWHALHAGKYIGGRSGLDATADGLLGVVEMAERAGWGARAGVDYDQRSWAIEVGYDANRAGVPDPRRPRLCARSANYSVGVPLIPETPLVTSAILGLFRIVGVDAPGQGDLGGWRVPDAYGWRIEYRPLGAPLPCPGAQGFWNVYDQRAKVNTSRCYEADRPLFEALTAGAPFSGLGLTLWPEWAWAIHALPAPPLETP